MKRSETDNEKAERREAKTLRCPICKAATDESNEAFPFCSHRCRLVDLGKWIDGDYKISREIKDSDLETTD